MSRMEERGRANGASGRRPRPETVGELDQVGAAGPGRVLLSPVALAEYLGVPLATVYRWRSRGDGPCGIRVGRHVRYRLDDIERWLDEHREQRA